MLGRSRRKKAQVVAELDITAFMNLMIVLVPVLLLSMVFTRITVIDIRLPNPSTGELEPIDPETLQLEVIIRDDALVLADTNAGPIERFAMSEDGEHDYKGLSALLQGIKQKIISDGVEKRDITILSEEGTPYQVLVSVMDSVRSYPAVVAASVVEAELFPEIAIGDAPLLEENVATGGGQ